MDCAVMLPMVTGTPSTRDAAASSCGRRSPIRGTISKWIAPQMTANRNHADSISQNDQRAMAPVALSSGDGTGVKSFIMKLGMWQEL